MIAPVTERRNQALGQYLRTRREQTAPDSVGLAVGSRRRTPGLRREEAAQICGVGVTWYTWIEQGRDVSVSPWTLARLARGLKLTRAERAYLFELAGKHDPDRPTTPEDDIPDAVLASVDAIACPAYILDRTWTARKWNVLAGRLFVGWLDQGDRPNLLRFLFLRPESRRLFRDWDVRARRVTAEFRATVGHSVDNPAIAALIADLRAGNSDFARFWDMGSVQELGGGERTFDHPADGFQTYRQVSFTVSGWPDFRMAMLMPV